MKLKTKRHAAGDALLVEVSQRVQRLLTDNDLVARLGGDEFAIIQGVVRSAASEAKVLAEAIVSTLREPYQFNNQEINIGVSVGIATAPADGRNSHDLLRHADLALYAAKAQGRDRYMLYAAGMTMGSGIIE